MASFFGKRRKDEELMENINVGQRLSKTGFFTHDLVRDKLIMTSQVYNILCMESHDNIYNVIHDEGQKAFFEHEEMSFEISLKGKEKYLQVWTKTLFDKDKRPVKIYGALQDITDRKHIENNLKAFGEDLNIAQRVSGVGSWRYDVLKDKFHGTEEMFNIYGIKPEEFDNDFESTIKLIHPDDRDKVRHCLSEHFAGRSCEIEFRIPQKDGSMKYVKGKREAILNELGQTVCVIGTLRDITQEKLLQTQLEQHYRMMEQSQNLAKTGSWVYDIATNKSTSSKGVYRIFGIDPENFDNTYESFMSLVHHEDKSRIDKLLDSRFEGPFETKFRIVRPDGEVRYIHQVSEYVFDEKGNPEYLYGVVRDITEETKLYEEVAKQQEEIARLKNRYQMLLQESSDVYEIINPDGTIIYISDAVEKVLGCKPEERIGRKVYDFYEEEELEKVRNFINSVVENPGVRLKGDVKLRLKDGKELNIEAELQNLMDNPFIKGIVIHFRDISDIVEMKNKLTYISTHDDLTKLPNQSYFKEQLKSYCSEVKDTKMPFALMFISISGLSYVIYTLGYSIEQLLVLEIVKRLKELFNDNFIARYSADDFAIVLKHHEEDYESLAKRVISTLTKPYKIPQYELSVSVNVGINFFSDCNKDVDSFVQDTLQTVLRAKREGKNRYRFYSSSFDIQNFKDFFFRNDLRKAIETDQLSVRYQPIVNIWSGEILSVEALVRWEHPEWGLISPGEFIAIAEEMGLIIDVGNWMLNKVCQDLKKWTEKGIEKVDIAANFSSLQFLQKDFVNNLIGIIEKHEVDPSFLTIEVTESVLIDR
ncbi:MAG: PAS domain-containing protein, partial [Clostridiaceae bacterium]|nr:PAS domain-containing protein [Clostridiaceae bacterium]